MFFQRIFLPLLLGICFLFACQKEAPITLPNPITHLYKLLVRAFYTNRQRNSTFMGYKVIQEKAYLKDDSLCIEQQIIDYPQGRPAPADTTYWLYTGRKN